MVTGKARNRIHIMIWVMAPWDTNVTEGQGGDRGSTVLRNFAILQQHYTASQLTRPHRRENLKFRKRKRKFSGQRGRP
jgi:hypothetical protein